MPFPTSGSLAGTNRPQRASSVNRQRPLTLLVWLLLGSLTSTALAWLLLSDQVLLPSLFLRYVHPWANQPGPTPPPWNSLLWDGIAQYFPWRLYAAKNLQSGLLPLWNPYQFCGTPFLANGQSALLYPLNLPYWLLPVERAFGVSALLHLLLAALFTYLLLTRLKLPSAPSLFAAIAFALNGFFATWIHLPTAVNAAIWLPFLLWCAESARSSLKPLRWLPPTSLGLACCFFAGHLQTSFYILFAFLCYSLFRAFSQPPNSQLATRNPKLFWLAASVLLALLLVAAQLLPSTELASLSHRTAQKSLASYRTYVSFALPIPQLSLLLLPFSWGEPAQGTYFGKGTLSEFCPYVGFLTLLLALCSSPKTHRFLWWSSLTFCLFSLLAALGGWNNALFFFLIPGFERTGGPARILLLWHFFVNVLAAIGLANLLSLWRASPSLAQKRLLYSLLALLILLACLFALHQRSFLSRSISPPNPFLLDIRGTYLIAIGVILALMLATLRPMERPGVLVVPLALLLLADLGSFWRASLILSPAHSAFPKTELIRSLERKEGRIMPVSRSWSLSEPPQAVLPPNAAMVSGLYDVQGYDSLFPGEYKRVLAALLQEDPSPKANGNMLLLRRFSLPLAAFLGVRQVASLEPIYSPSLRLEAKLDGVYLYECRWSIPRAYLAGPASSLPDGDSALRTISSDWQLASLNNRFPAVRLAHSPTPASPSLSPEHPRPSPLSLQSLGPNRVRVTGTSQNADIAVVRDLLYPGWHAYLDGEPSSLIQADLLFRATAFPPGDHEIEYVFEPASFKVGFFLTLLGLACLAFILTFSLCARKP